jgi:formiminotetrahydrofolate cyclodeaminase
MQFEKETVEHFSELLASDNPTPGGGTSSALAGVIGAGFLVMIARISAQKKAFATQQDMLRGVERDGEALRKRLLSLMNEDTDAYDAIMAARRRPHGTDAEAALRNRSIEEATVAALAPPRGILDAADRGARLAETLLASYYTGTASDLGIAANCLLTAARGAYLTIHINLNALTDKELRAAEAERSFRQLSDIRARCERVYQGAGLALVPASALV